jgi:hypothetical protein
MAGPYQSLGRGRYKVGTRVTSELDERVVEVTVTSAELLALRATPKAIVPAAGAGKMNVFKSAVLIADNGTAYVVGTNDLAFRYASASGDIVSQTIDTAGLLDSTSDIVSFAGPIATDTKSPKADVENTAIYLHNTGGSELTTGTGVVRVKCWFSVTKTGW